MPVRIPKHDCSYGNYLNRFFPAITVGLVWSLAFPTPGIALLAWLVPGLLCALGLGRGFYSVLIPASVAGLTFNLISLRWLLAVPTGWSASIHWILLSLSLTPFPALWVWFCWRIAPTPLLEKSAVLAQNHHNSSSDHYARPTVWEIMIWTITCAAGWVALEFVQSHLFTGFPWNLLGSSQYRLISYIQLASVTGSSGLSFLMVWISLSFFCVIFTWPGGSITTRFAPIFIPGLVLLTVLVMGELRMTVPFPSGKTLRCALVQPGGQFTDIGDLQQRQDRFSNSVKLTQQIGPGTADLVLWPEGGAAKMLRWDAPTAQQIISLARSNSITMIVCTADADIAPGKNGNFQLNRYNAAFLIDPGGRLAATYRKEHLVPWHEYTPVAALRFLAPHATQFTPGHGPVAFDLPSLGVRTSALICFEDVFATLTRQRTALSLDFLVDVGDDGWFGLASAQWQHLASASLRAVENRLPLLHCTANGVTCSIDPFGRLSEFLPVGGQGVLYVDVPLPPRSGRNQTFYQTHGDWFVLVCVLWIATATAYGIISKRLL